VDGGSATGLGLIPWREAQVSEAQDWRKLFSVRRHCLEEWLYDNGYEIDRWELWRDPRWAQILAFFKMGSPKSLHCEGMAGDLYAWKDGHFLETEADYRPIADKWKASGGTWGGDFTGTTAGDWRHFSIPHPDGRR